jgi:hypothetical protein
MHQGQPIPRRLQLPRVIGRAGGWFGGNSRCNALWLWRVGPGGAACPTAHDGAFDTKPAAIWANTVRSGQLVGR